MAHAVATPPPVVEPDQDIIYPGAIPFVLVHLACFAAIWTGVTTKALLLGFVLYWIRMIGVTGGYHRYFSHRSYKTSRVGQMVIAFVAQSSAQRGPIWWAAVHRDHHKYSDTELDHHSPRHKGFLYSHMGWIFSKRSGKPDYSGVGDLTQYPELVWMDRHQYFPAFVVALGSWLFAGWPGLVVGFLWSTVVLYHCTFFINSLAHVHGSQRYLTGDDSRNNWWLAVITCGEGWHNNHHAYQSSTRQGFRWYQVDLTYYVLKALSWFGLVWDLRSPPREVVNNERRLGRLVVERVAQEIAEGFPAERLAQQLRAAWSGHPTWPELQARIRTETAAWWSHFQFPELPSLEEIRGRAARLRVPEVSLDEVSERARQLVLQAVGTRLLEPLPA